MREYAKLSPTFWTGETGKALRKRGSEAVIVALYLVSAPGSNMLGLYYQPLLFMAHETGLGIDGATKGLHACIQVGFCDYDGDTEMVYVKEMAAWQIAEELKPADLRCKGIQKDYESLPDNPFLEAWFVRYEQAFHLTTRRVGSREPTLFDDPPTKGPSKAPSKAPSKPGAGAGAGAGEAPNPSGSRRLAPTAGGREDPKPTIPCPYDAIVDAYHRELPSLPKIRLRDGPTWDERTKAMRSFWGWVLSSRKSDGTRRAETAEQAIDWIAAYFRRAAENDFVMGRSRPGAGHEGWRADLEYLLSKRGLKQVIEKTVERAA